MSRRRPNPLKSILPPHKKFLIVASAYSINALALTTPQTSLDQALPWATVLRHEINEPLTNSAKTWSLQKLPNENATALHAPDAPHLLGRYGLSAQDVLAIIAPHIAQHQHIKLKLQHLSTTAEGHSVHEVYNLWFGDYILNQAQLSLHHWRNKLVMVKYDQPPYHLPAQIYTADDFRTPAALGLAGTDNWRIIKQQPLIAAHNDLPLPAWRLVRTNGSQTQVLLVDAQTGVTLHEEPLGFATNTVYKGDVFPSNAFDDQTQRLTLPELKDSDRLDGSHFTVYGSAATAARAKAVGRVFAFDPTPSSDGALTFFDQTQAYYSAQRAYQFFANQFKYTLDKTNITIFVGGGPRGNAFYNPEELTIMIGRDSTVLRDLARDTDVIAHEFSHHVIAETLTKRSGEAAILHEGYADYFAYAMSGDAFLAESVTTADNYLRTALLPKDIRYDDPDIQKWSSHNIGQLWSAVLWQLREQIGSQKADQLAFASLRYLGANSGFDDAFLGLLNADRDLHPLPHDDADFEVFGANKCRILAAGIARGFALFLGGYDGSSCGLDLVQLAENSKGSLSVDQGGGRKEKILGQTCATLGNGAVDVRTFGSIWLCLLLPLLTLCRHQQARRDQRRLAKAHYRINKERPHGF